MELIDTHCHLDDSRFDHDRDDALVRARQAGVNRFIVAATTRNGWEKLERLAAVDATLLPAYGLHPWFCEQHQETDFARLSTLLDKAVAVGECGLDFGKGRATEREQMKWFRPQLELAAAKGLPVIVHACKSLDRVLREVSEFPQLRGVIHGFSGSHQQAEMVMARGFYLGIGGMVTYPQAGKLREIVKQMPLEHLLLETDAPDQSGVLHRGSRNEPAFLVEIAEEIATMRGMDVATLVDTCNHNARGLFAI